MELVSFRKRIRVFINIEKCSGTWRIPCIYDALRCTRALWQYASKLPTASYIQCAIDDTPPNNRWRGNLEDRGPQIGRQLLYRTHYNHSEGQSLYHRTILVRPLVRRPMVGSY